MHPFQKFAISLPIVCGAVGLTACHEPVLTAEEKLAADVKAAEQGSAEVQFKLAKMYEDGDGVAKDAVKAVEWYRKAAEQGSAKAQENLARMYYHGKGGLPKDLFKTVEWCQKAAEQHDANGQLCLGNRYRFGEGVTKDAVKAVELYQKSADQGNAKAQYLLGWMYYNGQGLSKDFTKAFEWFLKSAEQGNSDAQLHLGVMYFAGEGVIKNMVVAADWYRKSAEQGNAYAQLNLGSSYANGKGVAKDDAKSVEWYRKSAEQGNAEAQSLLAFKYLSGLGVTRNKILAHAWANIAASQGHEQDAQSFYLVYEATLSKSELREAQRIASNWKPGNSLVLGAEYGDALPTSSGASKPTKQGTGTGFWVSKSGYLVTNQHVVAGCAELRFEGREGVAKLVTEDRHNDLALLTVVGEVKAVAKLNDAPDKLRQGEDIVVFGFPLNALLSSGGNLTLGVVSAITGLGNNSNQIQITAPIQPGSSGSPVLNKKGEVVAVVSMKLSDTKMAQATGSVGQNVNFAVSGQTLKAFLDANKVEYIKGGFFSFEKKTADIAEEARKWTTVIECWK